MNRQNNIDLLVVNLTVPSSAQIIIVSNTWIICECQTVRLWKEMVIHNWRCYSGICLEELTKAFENLVRIVDVVARTGNKYFPNMCHKCYHFNKPPLKQPHSRKNECLLPAKCSLCDWHVFLALKKCHVLFYYTTGYASLSVCWSGTLIQGAVLDKRTAIGLILGTGSNACYMERANRVQHWEGQRHGEKQVMLILMIPIYTDLHLFHT